MNHRAQKNIIFYEMDEKGIIQKSTPLQHLADSPLTLSEFKILDLYLSKIDITKPEENEIVFNKGEIERCLNVSLITRKDLIKRLTNLMTAIKIDDINDPTHTILMPLFAKIDIYQQKNKYVIKLKSTEEAKQYFFNIQQLGYLKYKLHNVINLKSRYSYLLFLLLDKNKIYSPYKINIDDLKIKLNATAETYKKNKRFIDKVLEDAVDEISNKTQLRVSYRTIKDKKQITDIVFIIKDKGTKNKLLKSMIAERDEQLNNKCLKEVKTYDEEQAVQEEAEQKELKNLIDINIW